VKKKRILQIITILLVITAAICGFLFAREYVEMQEEISEYSSLRNSYTSEVNAPICDSSDPAESKETTESEETESLPTIEIDFNGLMAINPDTVGWIMIPNTVISYPVVQTTNNSKYLATSFEGNRSKAGTPFANKDNSMESLDSNTIIYGHNMGTGRTDMFSTLLLYKNHDYFMANRFILFGTIYQPHGWWKVFAVIELNASNTEFHCQQIEFHDEDEFMEWIATAMTLSVHSTDVLITPQDNILTLSTCDRSRYGRNGRLIILAVKMQPEINS